MIEIEHTTDMDLVRDIMTTPYIWNRAAEDVLNPSDYYPTHDIMTLWLLIKEDDNVLGIMLMHVDSGVSVKIHFYMLDEYRSLAKYAMMAFYKFIINIPEAEKVNASVPEIYPEVIKFSEKVGFKKEGVNRNSFLKDGKICNQVMLGITREEIARLI